MNNDPTRTTEMVQDEISKWPKVIGVICLIYAIGGLFCQSGFVAWTFLGEQFARMGGFDFKVPAAIKLMAVASGAIMVFLGILMIVGAVNLLRRQQRGVQLLKAWVVLRVIMIVIGLGIQVIIAPTNLQMQRSIEAATNQKLREAGRPEVPIKSDDEIWRQTMIGAGVVSGAFSIFPVFLGFYLSRRRVTNEIRAWR